MSTRVGVVVLIALAAVGCGRGKSSPDAAADGNGGGRAGTTGGAGRGGAGGGGSGGQSGSAGGAGGDSGVAGRGGAGGGAGSGGHAGQGGDSGMAGRGGAGGGAGSSGGNAGQGGSGGNAGQGGSGGTGGATGSGGTGGGGSPAGVSYVGCTFIGGINRVVVSKRDTAGNQCLSFALAERASPGQPTPGLSLPAGWYLERVTVGPASSCPTRNGTPVAGEVTGTVTWAVPRPGSSNYPARANINVTLTLPANDAGASSVERIEGEDVDVLPACDSASNQCSFALPVRCGDRLNHSTVVEGRANTWGGYGRTARGLSGRETIYSFSSASTCEVVANLKNLTTDLDLLLLSACDPITSNEMASSTPLDLQTFETVSWTNLPGQISYVVVDGYAGAEGSYSLEVDCTCR
jgi:hypothetical protein